MTLTATKPHPIFLAGRWVESPDRLDIANPARPDEPAGATYNATSEQYEEAVNAALDESFARAEALLFERFGEVTLAMVHADFHERLARCASHCDFKGGSHAA